MTNEQLERALSLRSILEQLPVLIEEIDKAINPDFPHSAMVYWKNFKTSEVFESWQMVDPPASVRNFLIDRKKELMCALAEAQAEFENL